MTATALARHYNEKYRNQISPVPVRVSGYPRDRFENAVTLASRDAGGSYLEIGAGDGRCALGLVDRYESLTLTDISDPRIEVLRRTFEHERKVRVLKHNVEYEDLPFDTFDTVAMTAVIEHFIDPIGVLRNVHRALRPAGRVIIDTPNIAKWTRRINLAAGYFPSTASLDEGFLGYDRKTATDLHDDGHLHYFTFRSLRRLCTERAGFRAVEYGPYGPPLLSRAWPQLFSEVSIIAYK